MKLYYAPGACSLAPHIALEESGLPYEATRVDLGSHTFGSGNDYYEVNAKGYVPVLELDDGARLTEAAVILQYIADRKPGTLAPSFGSFERYRGRADTPADSHHGHERIRGRIRRTSHHDGGHDSIPGLSEIQPVVRPGCQPDICLSRRSGRHGQLGELCADHGWLPAS